jgi:hypothetical protein
VFIGQAPPTPARAIGEGQFFGGAHLPDMVRMFGARPGFARVPTAGSSVQVRLDQPARGGYGVYLRDPNGIPIEFFQPPRRVPFQLQGFAMP